MWRTIRQQNKSNKPKIIASTWNGEFELPDGSYSVSDIQDYTDEDSWNVEEIVFLRKERQKLVFFVFALVKKLFLMFLIKLIKKNTMK